MMIVQVGSSKADAVWVYTLTYGGGIVTVCNYLLPLFSGLYCYAVILSSLFMNSFVVVFRGILFLVNSPLEKVAPLS